MKSILITGAEGFLGSNLCAHLSQRKGLRLNLCGAHSTNDELRAWSSSADVIFHLAGVNRPKHVEEFETGNAGFTGMLVEAIAASGEKPHVIMSSSIQAALDNPYGRSKRQAEEILRQFSEKTGAPVSIFRLKNVFGKWCRPNYNSVTATFCHNIAHDMPVQISDPDHQVDLAYVDDVVNAFIQEMATTPERPSCMVDPDPIPSHLITLGDLAAQIQFFRDMQVTQFLPDFSIPFNKQLYATYLSYVPRDRWEYGPQKIHTDDRGNLAELIKSPQFGQIFISRTKPGITRGMHYHHTKTEKFMVVAGEGLIRFRHVNETEVIEIRVRGEDYRIVEIPPGYTHSITNAGDTEMITVFWVCEMLDLDRPDTYYVPVDVIEGE